MNRPLIIALLVAAVTTWTLETMNRERLTKRLDVMRQNTRGLARVRKDNEELIRRQPFVGEIDTLRRDRAELAGLRREIARRQHPGPGRDAALSALGREELPRAIWLPTAGMTDLGRGTPHAALQTLFWAVGAENVPALRDMVGFESGGRERAEKIIASLPESAGLRHGPPEMLIAHALVRQAPAGEINLIAEQLKGFDEATEYFTWKTPDGNRRAIHLRLRWEPGGWRFVVPTEAVENAGRELTGLPATPAPDPFRDAPRAPEP